MQDPQDQIVGGVWPLDNPADEPALDTATRKAKTESGRVYTLGSRTQGNLDSDYVFASWRLANGATDCDNVTKAVKALLSKAESP